MAAVVDPSASSENGQSRVALHFPEGRELLWTNRDSPLCTWEVGQPVVYRNVSWVVLSRTESAVDASITLTLGAA
jgi:hypothetical protein